MAADDDPDVKPDHIDILQMEIDQKLPHWLSWPQRHADKAAAIRDRLRKKWLERFGQPHRDGG